VAGEPGGALGPLTPFATTPSAPTPPEAHRGLAVILGGVDAQITGDKPTGAEGQARPRRLQDRAEYLASLNIFVGGPVADFERIGRLQLEMMIHEGLYPTSNVLDVGCGCLRGGYWVMHFVDPGHYFGIEPWDECLQAGLEHIVEPQLLEQAKPTFTKNEDFDFSVFGQTFDFVVARSVWTHASKPQIEQMLDSFRDTGRQGAVFLVSYLPAATVPERIRRPLAQATNGLRRAVPSLQRVIPGRWDRPDHQGGWSSPVIGHSREWLLDACARRGLKLRELDYGVMNGQVWLRIDHPLPPTAAVVAALPM
jgi:SAM-dependent methyltransferase